MSRLRNIQGVTRVSLSKSEKSDAVASAGSDRAVRQGLPAELRARRLLREGDRLGADLANATKDAGARSGAGRQHGDAAATPTPAATKEGATP